MQYKGKAPNFFQANEWKKEERANQQSGRIAEHSRRCDRTRWEMLMTRGHCKLVGPMREIGTEMNEQTVEKFVMAAWKETEKEHKNYVAKRIRRRNEKLNKAHSTNGKYLRQWIRQDYQTPIATMKRTDGSITMNFQEIPQTLVVAWRPIFARWDRGEEPRYSDFEERFGRFIPNEPMDAKSDHWRGTA